MADIPVTPLYLHPQTQTVSIVNEPDEEFNYELVQLRYLEACEEFFQTPNSVTGPWTQKARELIILSIKENNQVLSLMESVYNMPHDVLETYQLVMEGEDEKLVLTGTATEVLPYEECFDIFVELHKKTKHGGFAAIMSKLRNTFVVHDTCLTFFLLKCNTCKKLNLQKMKPAKFNDCVNIEILKAPIPDNDCKYILFYIDTVTTFTLFRPLIAMDEYEISIEMLKIFTDFGPPVVIRTIHAPLFNNVLLVLGRGGFHFDISVHASDKVIGESYYLMHEIVAQTSRDCTYWSTSCRFVQYKHNNGQLPMRDPIMKKVVHTSVKPLNQLFNTKHSANNESLTEKQTSVGNKNMDASGTVGKSSNLGTNEENSISSETDTTSEEEESSQIIERKEESHLDKHQNENDLKVTTYISIECNEQTYNPTTDNMDIIDSNEIKMEYNPIQTDFPKKSNVETLADTSIIPKTEEMIIVSGYTDFPIIVNSIPVKEEVVLEESCISSSLCMDTHLNMDAQGTSTEKVVSDATLRGNINELNLNPKTAYCSACEGKMLTNYFCFGCKKETHIFCMSRVTVPLENITEPVTSFTYCHLCLKSKYNLTNAVKINY